MGCVPRTGSALRGPSFDMQRRTGAVGEQMALQYLEKQGMQHIASNVRFKQGEIDLIMRDGATIVFCEVKTRAYSASASAFEAITPAKQKRISACALMFLKKHGLLGQNVRFDAIAVNGYAEQCTFTHIKAAFNFNATRYFV